MNTLNAGHWEREVVDATVVALRELGVALEVEPPSAGEQRGDLRPDGYAVVRLDGREVRYPVEVKRGLRPSTAALLAAQVGEGLLISDHISPAVGDLLRARGVQYVDSAGNAHLRGAGVLVDVRGRRAREGVARSVRKASPLFTRAGLPVVLAVLEEPRLIEAPLREVQARTTVSLGSVQKVMAHLREQGYRASDTPDEGRWRRLYDGWVAAYLAGPRDDALVGRYSTRLRPDDVVRALADGDVTLSGESAARAAGYDIAPVTLDLYVRDSVGPAVTAGRLRPDPDGTVTVRRPVWTPGSERELGRGGPTHRLAPGPVVYADLLALQDPRGEHLAEEWRSHGTRLQPRT